MTIRLITGRQEDIGRALSTRIYRELGEAADTAAAPCLLIVPEQFTLGAERALMAANGWEGLMGAEVLSLGRLAARIFSETGGATRTLVDDHGRQMLLARTLLRLKGDLTVYGSSAGRPGFLNEVGSFISELKQNRIDDQAVEKAIEAMDADTLLSKKLADTLSIYRGYQQELGEKRWDSDARSAALCAKIAESSRLGKTRLWFDGFFTFSERDFAVVEALAARVPQLTMSLLGDLDSCAPDAQIFDLCRKTASRMEAIAHETGHAFEIRRIEPAVKKAAPLACLARQAFAYQKEPEAGAPEAIVLRQCRDPWDEAEQALQIIAGLTRDKGLAYGDISILCGDPAGYGKTVERVLTAAGIPVFLDARRPIEDSNLVEALLAVLEILESRYGEDGLFAYAKSGFAPLPQQHWRTLENYAVAFGIRGLSWERPFVYNDEAGSWDLEALNGWREQLIAPIAAFRLQMKGRRSYRDRLKATFGFLTATGVPQSLEDMGKALEDREDYETLGQYHQIWNILMTVFDQVDGAMGETPCTTEEFSGVLSSGFSTYEIGILPERRDVVAITDPFRSRSEGTRALLILGANEGVLPSEDTHFNLLNEGERRQLETLGIDLKDTPGYRQSRGSYTMYLQLAQVSEFLYCSWSLRDGDGEARGPSELVAGICRIFPDLPVQSALKTDPRSLDWIAGPRGTLSQWSRRQGEKPATPDSVRVGSWYAAHPDFKDLCGRLGRAADYKGVSDSLPREVVRELYGSGLKVSVKRLEQFNTCPFAHFLQYGLRPKPRDEYTVALPEIGTVLHGVIEAVFKRAQIQGTAVQDLPASQRDAWAAQALKEQLAKPANRAFFSTGSTRYLGRKMERVSRQTLRVLSDQLAQGAFTFKYSEHAFEEAVALPQLPPGVSVRGVVDRIDLCVREGDTFIKVVDYKTGGTTLDLAEVYYGLSIQLLVYLGAGIDQASQEAGVSCIPGGTFYFHVDDPMVTASPEDEGDLQKRIDKEFQMNGLFLDDPRLMAALDASGERGSSVYQKGSGKSRLTLEEFDDLLAFTRKVVEDGVAAIWGGKTALQPYRLGERNPCTTCDYAAICQFDERLNRAACRVLNARISKEMLLEKARKEGEAHGMDQGTD